MPVSMPFDRLSSKPQSLSLFVVVARRFHKQFPKIPFISSESCSCTSDRDYQVNDTEALIGAQSSWSCIKDCWQPIATREFVQGSFDWTGLFLSPLTEAC